VLSSIKGHHAIEGETDFERFAGIERIRGESLKRKGGGGKGIRRQGKKATWGVQPMKRESA